MKRDKRTEAERMADDLLCASKRWQNYGIVPAPFCRAPHIEQCWQGIYEEPVSAWASAALSEAAALGFDIETVGS